MTADTRPGKEDGAGDGHLDFPGSTASPLLLERRGPHPVPDTIRISPEQRKGQIHRSLIHVTHIVPIDLLLA
jgi:hypothetical protein